MDNILKNIESFIKSNERTFAKTYATFAPHEYIVKSKLKSDSDKNLFEDFVMYIRNNGYKKIFYSKEYICFDIGPHRYWTMGSPLNETIIINRAIN